MTRLVALLLFATAHASSWLAQLALSNRSACYFGVSIDNATGRYGCRKAKNATAKVSSATRAKRLAAGFQTWEGRTWGGGTYKMLGDTKLLVDKATGKFDTARSASKCQSLCQKDRRCAKYTFKVVKLKRLKPMCFLKGAAEAKALRKCSTGKKVRKCISGAKKAAGLEAGRTTTAARAAWDREMAEASMAAAAARRKKREETARERANRSVDDLWAIAYGPRNVTSLRRPR